MRSFILALGALLMSGTAMAGSKDSLGNGVVNMSFIPPLSFYGISSGNYTYNFSLNMIAGYSGGIKGFEVGSVWNGVRQDMNGFQVGGVGNTVGGDVNGFQVAGLLNTGKRVTGSQIGGVVNIASQDFQGLQIGGLLNIAKADHEHSQKEFNTQIAGLVNAGGQHDHFVQISGLVNTARAIKSTQITGIYNVANEVEGVQISGLINHDKGDLNGIQIGTINKAGKVKGSQIGFINRADSVDGVTLGALNFSKKNGKYSWDLMASDVFFANMRFTSGVNNLYNFLTIGTKYTSDLYWGYGIGIGYQMEKGKNTTFFTEATWSHVTEKELWNKNYFNHLISIAYGAEWGAKEKGNAYRLAPVLNMYFAKKRDNHYNLLPDSEMPLYSEKIKSQNSDLHVWVGLQFTYRMKY